MDEYIKREAACADCLYYEVCPLGLATKGGYGTCLAFKNKDDVVEVVRCKDCKHYKSQAVSTQWEHKAKYCCRCVAIKVKPDDYCSYGAKNDGGNNG